MSRRKKCTDEKFTDGLSDSDMKFSEKKSLKMCSDEKIRLTRTDWGKNPCYMCAIMCELCQNFGAASSLTPYAQISGQGWLNKFWRKWMIQ